MKRAFLYSCQVLAPATEPWNRSIWLHYVDEQAKTSSFMVGDYATSILIRCVDTSDNDVEDVASVQSILSTYVFSIQRRGEPRQKNSYYEDPIQDITQEDRVPVIGFCNNAKHRLYRLTLRALYLRRRVIRDLQRYNRDRDLQLPSFIILHTNVKDQMQILYQNQWRLHSWYQLDVTELSSSVRMAQVTHQAVDTTIPGLRVAFIRISAHSSTATRTNPFQPDPEIKSDYVTSVYVSLFIGGQLDHRQQMENDDETTILLRLKQWMLQHTPSVLVHMSDPYDHVTYLHLRMKMHRLRLTTIPTCECIENRIVKDGGVIGPIRDVTIPGCELVDLRHVLQKFMITPNLDGFTLADVVSHPKLLRSRFERPTTPASELKVIEALERDNNFVLNNCALSKSCDLSLQSIISRGQQTRVFSCFLREYHVANLYLNDKMVQKPFLVVRRSRSESSFSDPPWIQNPPLSSLRSSSEQPLVQPTKKRKLHPTTLRKFLNLPNKPPETSKRASTKRYGGGFVIRPEAGFYVRPEHAVSTLDFASLYPSIMCGYNICFMRVCYDPKWLHDERATKQYIPLDDSTCCVFITKYDGVPVRTITDKLVRDVMENRKRTRAKMKMVQDPFQLQSLDAQQLCCKVLQNAVYGACGSETFPIRCTALAASVCTIGQWMNKKVRFLAMQRGCICVYGDTDSVMLQFSTDPSLTSRDDILRDIYRQAHALERYATAEFPAPNAVEFETLKLPFLMTDRKKTYAAYEYPPVTRGWTKEPKTLVKGFTIKKRDRCPMVQELGFTLVKRLLSNSHSESDTVQWFRHSLTKLHARRPETLEQLQPFIISCRLNDTYKQPNVIGPHLADQYEAEDGIRPQPGDRMKYVVVHIPDRKHFESTMMPSGFLAGTLPLNMHYYLQKQLMLSLKQVLNQHPTLERAFQQCIHQELTTISHKRQRIQTLATFV